MSVYSIISTGARGNFYFRLNLNVLVYAGEQIVVHRTCPSPSCPVECHLGARCGLFDNNY